MWTGRGTFLKRADFKAKGRTGLIRKPRTHLYLRARLATEEEMAGFRVHLHKGLLVRPKEPLRERQRKGQERSQRRRDTPSVNFWPLR